MSLSGLLPPINSGGDLLLDGGYMDNLTVKPMRNLFGARTIIAIDVAAAYDTSAVHSGDVVNGFLALLQSWNPFRSSPNLPNIAEIQSRLAFVSSVERLNEALLIPGCLYLDPPVKGFATLDFSKFNDIFDIGYVFGKQKVKEWRQDGTLEKLIGPDESITTKDAQSHGKKGPRHRRKSF